MNEKTAIERGTAEGFLSLYNTSCGCDYQIEEISDAPDVRCMDSRGNILNLEVTTTEDRPGDIMALVGRSTGRSLEDLVAHTEKVAAGLEAPQFSSLGEDVMANLIQRIRAKLVMDYGPNTALVVRDTSGCDWEWDVIAKPLRNRLDLSRNPFERGIWILSRTKDRLTAVVDPEADV